MSTPTSTSSSSSSSRNGANGGSRKDQRKKNRESKLAKGKSAVPKEDGPTETADQASIGAPDEVGDIKDKLGESSTQQDVRDSENSNEELSLKIYDGDNWGPESPSTGKGKILKRGKRRQENHDLPPLQIAGMVLPSRGKILRDREFSINQEELHTDISERIHRGGRGGGGEITTNPGVQKNEKVAR